MDTNPLAARDWSKVPGATVEPPMPSMASLAVKVSWVIAATALVCAASCCVAMWIHASPIPA
jgi:hypothetical protein